MAAPSYLFCLLALEVQNARMERMVDKQKFASQTAPGLGRKTPLESACRRGSDQLIEYRYNVSARRTYRL